MPAGKNSSHASFMVLKLSIVVRKMFALTTFCRLLPASSKTAARFFRAWRWVEVRGSVMCTLIVAITHGLFFHAALRKFGCLRVKSQAARTVDHAIVFDRRGKLWQWFRCLIGDDSFGGRHFWGVSVNNLELRERKRSVSSCGPALLSMASSSGVHRSSDRERGRNSTQR